MSHLFTSDNHNIGASASASVLPVNIQGCSPLRLTGLISLLFKALSEDFSSTIVWRHQFFGVLLSLQALTTIHDHWEDHSLDYMDLCGQNNVSAFQHTRFVITFLPRSNCLLTSWLQSLSTEILEFKKWNLSLLPSFPLNLPCIYRAGCHDIHFFFQYLVLSQLFLSIPSSSSRASLVPLCFRPLEWYDLHIWGCWCFSHLSFSWCAQCIS